MATEGPGFEPERPRQQTPAAGVKCFGARRSAAGRSSSVSTDALEGGRNVGLARDHSLYALVDATCVRGHGSRERLVTVVPAPASAAPCPRASVGRLRMFVDQVKIFVRGRRRRKRVCELPPRGPSAGWARRRRRGLGGDVVLVDVLHQTPCLSPMDTQPVAPCPAAAGTAREGTARAATASDPGRPCPPGHLSAHDDGSGAGWARCCGRDRLVVARGGRGGRGNRPFSRTATAPAESEPGQPGSSGWLQLDLRLLADVGSSRCERGKSPSSPASRAAAPQGRRVPVHDALPRARGGGGRRAVVRGGGHPRHHRGGAPGSGAGLAVPRHGGA